IQRGYTLTEDDRLRREVILDLMCQERIDFGKFEDRYQIDFRTYFADALAQLEEPLADGLVAINEDGLVLLPEGKLMLRNVAMAFAACLGTEQKGRYSRPVWSAGRVSRGQAAPARNPPPAWACRTDSPRTGDSRAS